MFCTQAFSRLRRISRGSSKLGPCSRIIITSSAVRRRTRTKARASRKCSLCFISTLPSGSIGSTKRPGRKIWHNFWDTKLTYQKSYLARLNYVHQNPVKHGLVPVANQYPWCSAAWFEDVAAPSMIRSIYRFKIDALSMKDDFIPVLD